MPTTMPRPHKICSLDPPDYLPVYCLARFISTYNGRILRVDRLYTPCKYETLRAAQEIHQNFDESVAGNVVSEPDFVKSRHVADRRITKIMIYDQQPALGVSRLDPPRLEIIFA